MSEIENEQALELLTFKLGKQEYSLDIMSVREIRSWTRTTPLPHAPDYMMGVINLRGTVLPVVNLALRLKLEDSEYSDRNVIIVVHHGESMTGLLVDAVSDILALSSDDLQQPPETQRDNDPNLVAALTLIDDRMIRVLNLGSIVKPLERSAA